jgi:putative copper resistance protein D
MWLRWGVLYLHLLAAMFWIGEMLFLALVAGPYSRTLAAADRAELFRSLGRRSRPYAWTAIGVLLVTGVGNLLLMGLAPAQLLTWAFYRTSLGQVLGLKLAAVALLLAGVVGHDVVLVERSARLGERLRREGPSAALLAEIERARRWASWLGRVNLLLALVVSLLGTGLVVGA